ncbi:MAG: DUF2793 domain-containing protein [Pseudomonadota bacterium]
METTPNLKLPYIVPSQAQKHVTHNEAIRRLDALVHVSAMSRTVTQPPETPGDGQRYIVPVGAEGAWAQQDHALAAWQDDAWAFYPPQLGWMCWLADEEKHVVWNGSAWIDAVDVGSALNSLSELGVNATADTTNRLAVSSHSVLLDHAGQGHQTKINKATDVHTASLLFQTAYSGRAEMGLAGDDDFRIKVSPDGATFHDALVVDRQNGAVTFPNSSFTATGGGGGADPAGADGDLQFRSGAALAGGGPTFATATGTLTTPGSVSLPDTSDVNTGTLKVNGKAFAHFFGSSNTFFGETAGNFALTGGFNTGIGSSVLKSLTTGQRNAAIGAQAMIFTTTGSFNMAMGFYALRYNTTGSRNVAIGDVAGYGCTAAGRNVFIGFASGYRASTAQRNTFIGDSSGDDITSGARNTFIGANAGQGVATGDGNVILGTSEALPPDLGNTFMLFVGSQIKRMEIDLDGYVSFQGPVRPKSYTVTTLPAAAAVGAGSQAFCTDEAGGAVPVFSDGVAWRRCTDRQVVS